MTIIAFQGLHSIQNQQDNTSWWTYIKQWINIKHTRLGSTGSFDNKLLQYSDLVYVFLQGSTLAADMMETKKAFKIFAIKSGTKICHYNADYGILPQGFLASLYWLKANIFILLLWCTSSRWYLWRPNSRSQQLNTHWTCLCCIPSPCGNSGNKSYALQYASFLCLMLPKNRHAKSPKKNCFLVPACAGQHGTYLLLPALCMT